MLVADIPFWFDTLTHTYKSQTKPLNQHVQDIVDQVVIMDYRDFAVGNDGIIYHAEDEVAYANAIGKSIIIGVETNAAGLDKVSFIEEGEAIMETELVIVEQHFSVNQAFDGFAIHDYLGYKTMAPLEKYFSLKCLGNNLLKMRNLLSEPRSRFCIARALVREVEVIMGQ